MIRNNPTIRVGDVFKNSAGNKYVILSVKKDVVGIYFTCKQLNHGTSYIQGPFIWSNAKWHITGHEDGYDNATT